MTTGRIDYDTAAAATAAGEGLFCCCCCVSPRKSTDSGCVARAASWLCRWMCAIDSLTWVSLLSLALLAVLAPVRAAACILVFAICSEVTLRWVDRAWDSSIGSVRLAVRSRAAAARALFAACVVIVAGEFILCHQPWAWNTPFSGMAAADPGTLIQKLSSWTLFATVILQVLYMASVACVYGRPHAFPSATLSECIQLPHTDETTTAVAAAREDAECGAAHERVRLIDIVPLQQQQQQQQQQPPPLPPVMAATATAPIAVPAATLPVVTQQQQPQHQRQPTRSGVQGVYASLRLQKILADTDTDG